MAGGVLYLSSSGKTLLKGGIVWENAWGEAWLQSRRITQQMILEESTCLTYDWIDNNKKKRNLPARGYTYLLFCEQTLAWTGWVPQEFPAYSS